MKSVDLKSFSICNPSTRLLCRTLAVSALMLGLSAIPASAEDNGCSNATLKGDYAYAVSGSATIPPAGFVAILGRIALDGKGSFTGSVNGSIAGIVILKDVAVTGSYRIASDCTGTLTTDYPAFTAHWSVVLVEGAGGQRRADLVETDAETVGTGTVSPMKIGCDPHRD